MNEILCFLEIIPKKIENGDEKKREKEDAERGWGGETVFLHGLKRKSSLPKQNSYK